MANRDVVRASLFAAAVAVAGCGTSPSQVAMPKATDEHKDGTDPRTRYKVGDKALSDATLDGILPVEKTFLDAKAQVDAHIVTWMQEAENLSKGVDGLGNIQFGGAVVGAIGAIVSKVDVTKAGAAAAGGAGVWDNHYQLAVQAKNYELAGDAMGCIRKELTKLPPSFWSATYYEAGNNVGSMKLDVEAVRQDGQSDEEAVAGFNTLQALFETIHANVLEVRKRLVKAQRGIKLATPSATDIQSALTNSASAERKADEQAGQMKRGLSASLAVPSAMPAQPRATTQAVRRSDGKAIVMTIKPSAADIAKYDAEVGRFKRLFENMSSSEIAQKQRMLRDSASLPKADYATALKMPAALETCTKLIGG